MATDVSGMHPPSLACVHADRATSSELGIPHRLSQG